MDSIIIIKDEEQLLLDLCRVLYTNLLVIETIVILGFNAFCASILPLAKANDIGYFPLIASSPTDAGVTKTAVNMKHTVITCDLDVYKIAYYTSRQKYSNIFSNAVLQLGRFHLYHNHEIDHKGDESGAETIFFT